MRTKERDEDEKIRRARTAARLIAMRNALIWYAKHMPNQRANNYQALDIELRRQAVQEVRDGEKDQPR